MKYHSRVVFSSLSLSSPEILLTSRDSTGKRNLRDLVHVTSIQCYCIPRGIKMQKMSVFPIFTKKHNPKGTWIGVFQPNVQIFKLSHYQTTAAILTQFCIVIKTYRYSLWVVPKCAPEIQDGGRQPLKKMKKNVISATVAPISTTCASYDVFPCIDVPLGGLGWYCSLHRGQIPPPKKNHFGAWIGDFQPNAQIIQSFVLSKLLQQFQPNFAQWWRPSRVQKILFVGRGLLLLHFPFPHFQRPLLS